MVWGSLSKFAFINHFGGSQENVMASLEEATIQRRVFAWQGPDTEPWTGTESSSAGAGWTITRDDVVVLIEQLRNGAGAAVAFVELQVDGRRTTHRGWIDPASLKRRPGDETEDELAWRREQLAEVAGEHLAGRAYAEAYHAFGEAIAADPANHLLYSDRALCCARLHKETPSPELRAAGLGEELEAAREKAARLDKTEFELRRLKLQLGSIKTAFNQVYATIGPEGGGQADGAARVNGQNGRQNGHMNGVTAHNGLNGASAAPPPLATSARSRCAAAASSLRNVSATTATPAKRGSAPWNAPARKARSALSHSARPSPKKCCPWPLMRNVSSSVAWSAPTLSADQSAPALDWRSGVRRAKFRCTAADPCARQAGDTCRSPVAATASKGAAKPRSSPARAAEAAAAAAMKKNRRIGEAKASKKSTL